MKSKILLIFIIFELVVAGCKPFKGSNWDVSSTVTKKKELNSTLTSVNVSNNQIIINGSGFSEVENVQIKGNGIDAALTISSLNDSQIIAKATSALVLLTNGTFNLIIDSAEAQVTYPITFTLQDGVVTAAKLSSMGAVSGQILKFDGTNWGPSTFSNSQIYIGTWNASTDTPNLASTSPIAGDYYIVSTAGTYNAEAYSVGDWIIYDGSMWSKISSAGGANLLLSGGTLTGDLVLNTLLKFKGASNYVTLKASNSLVGDIVFTLPASVGTSGQILSTNGAGVMSWITPASTNPTGSAGGELSGTYPNPTIASGLAATKIADGSVSNAQFQYVSGVTSNIQTQLSGKEPAITAGTTAKYWRGDKSFQTLDTSVVTENTNLYFTNARALAVPLTGIDTTLVGTIAATDTLLQAFGKTQAQINSIGGVASDYVTKVGTSTVAGTIDARSGFVLVGTPGTANDATPRTYVDTAVATTVAKTGDAMSGDLTLNTQLKLKNGGAANYVTLKAPPTGTTAYTLSLPLTAGSANQVLTTDGTGIMSWSTPSTSATPTGTAGGDLTGTFPNPTIATGLAATKIADGSVSNVQFQYVSGVTSNIQAQLNAIGVAVSDYVTKVGTSTVVGTIDARSGFVLVGTPGTANDATPRTYVDTAVATTVAKTGDAMSGDLTLNTQLKLKNGGAANYVTLKAPPTGTTAYTLSLPLTAGSANQVLTTDGTGIMSWSTPSTSATPTGTAGGDLTGTFPNPTIATGLAATKIADGSVSNAQFQYMSGVTSNIQTQLNGKASTTLTSAKFLVGNGSNVATGVTMSGDATLSNAGALTLNTVTVAKGGTGLTAGTSGGIPYYNSTSTMDSSGVLATNGVVLGGGAGATPTSTVAGIADQVLRVPAAGGAPEFGPIDLTKSAAVSGTLPVANGGTGITTIAANQLLFGSATGVISGLTAPSTSTSSVLLSALTTGLPTWTTSTTGNVLQGSPSGLVFGPITNLSPGSSDFSITQNSVNPFKSISSGAVDNTLYMKAGNVGIRTIAPSGVLSVNPPQYATGTASQSGTTVTGSGTTFTAAMVGAQFTFANGVTSGAITAFTNASTVTVTTSQTVASQAFSINYSGLNVTSTGFVGVGTAAPAYELDVNGTTHATKFVLGSNLLSIVQNGFQFQLNGHVYVPTNYVMGIGVAPSSTHQLLVQGGTADNTKSALNVQNSSATPLLFVRNDGNVGIGTASPAYPLDVSTGAVNAGSFNVNGGGGNANFSTFNISGATAGQLAILNNSSNAAAYTTLTGGKNAVSHLDLQSTTAVGTSDYVRILTGTQSEAMRIITNGYVGIGTTTPSTKLNVAGPIVSVPTAIASGVAVDLSTSNTFTLASVGGSSGSTVTIALTNLAHGGTYTVVITDSVSHLYDFSGCTTKYWRPASYATTSGTRSIFTLTTINTGSTNYDCYITWATGYQ